MFTRHLTVFIYILPLFVLILDLKCVLSMPKRYRIYRTKGPPSMPPIIQFSPPPRLLDAPPPRAAAQNFHSDYAPPSSIMMNGMSSYSPPGPSFDSPNNFLTDYQPPGMEYGPPKINNEYGPPKINTEYGPPTTLKPVVHKHVTWKTIYFRPWLVNSLNFLFFFKDLCSYSPARTRGAYNQVSVRCLNMKSWQIDRKTKMKKNSITKRK